MAEQCLNVKVVCAGCGEPTSISKPVCDHCIGFFAELGHPQCTLCLVGVPVVDGMHVTERGGHAGRCAAEVA